MLIFYRHPLRFETLCHVAGAVVQQKPGNCLKFSNFLGFICRIYEISEPKLVSFLLFWQNVPSDPWSRRRSRSYRHRREVSHWRQPGRRVPWPVHRQKFDSKWRNPSPRPSEYGLFDGFCWKGFLREKRATVRQRNSRNWEKALPDVDKSLFHQTPPGVFLIRHFCIMVQVGDDQHRQFIRAVAVSPHCVELRRIVLISLENYSIY